MSTTISNKATTSYTDNDSSSEVTITSNTNNVVLQDSQGITLTKTTGSSTFEAGTIITYTIDITNSGSQYFTGVRIIDDLANGNLAYVVGSAKLTVGPLTYAVTPIATNPLTFTLQQLSTGSSMTLTYNCQVIFNLSSSVTSLTNSVQGIGYTSTGTATGYTSHTIDRSPSNSLTVTKSSTQSNVLPNQVFSYTLTYTNSTSSEITINSISDKLESNFVITGITLKIGSGTTTTLSSTDYTHYSSGLLEIPSSTGPTITVPANGTTVITITGYYS